MGNEQAGFRSKHSTNDHIFVMNTLIDLYFKKKKKLYCAFIDFKKAFDSINRNALYLKLLEQDINGNFLTSITSMFNSAKSQVKYKGELSLSFPCLTGVRQGDNLSPFLFSLFLNDLSQTLSKS